MIGVHVDMADLPSVVTGGPQTVVRPFSFLDLRMDLDLYSYSLFPDGAIELEVDRVLVEGIIAFFLQGFCQVLAFLVQLFDVEGLPPLKRAFFPDKGSTVLFDPLCEVVTDRIEPVGRSRFEDVIDLCSLSFDGNEPEFFLLDPDH